MTTSLILLHGQKFLLMEPRIEGEGSAPVGGMWIVKAINKETIVALIEGDPMYQSGHGNLKSSLGKVLSFNEKFGGFWLSLLMPKSPDKSSKVYVEANRLYWF